MFIGDAPPERVVEALEHMKGSGPHTISRMKAMGFRNACAVLYGFGLIEIVDGHRYELADSDGHAGSSLDRVWSKARQDETLLQVTEFLRQHPSATPSQVGQFVAKCYERDWTPASHKRVGTSLRQWGSWLLMGDTREGVPSIPGRKKDDGTADPELFPTV